MMVEKNLKYLPAHKLATKIEDYFRHYPKKITQVLKQEIEAQP